MSLRQSITRWVSGFGARKEPMMFCCSSEEVIELITPVKPDKVKRADGWIFDLCFLQGSLQPDDEPLLRANDRIKVISGLKAQPPFTHVFRIEVIRKDKV